MLHTLRTCALVTSILTLAACSGGGPAQDLTGEGRLTLEITDAPLEHDLLEEATIWVDLVRAHKGSETDEDEGGWIVLHSDEELELNLFELTGGITRTLAKSRTLPTGKYRQLRLRVTRAYLRLVNGNEYSTENDTINLTSTGTSGFKVFIDPPLRILDDVDHDLLLDVDLGKTFLPVPSDEPLEASSFNLLPVIRTANLADSGRIRGYVLDSSGAPVHKATVYLLPEGSEDRDEAYASTSTLADGFFAILGAPAGVFDVLAVKGTLSGRAESIEVAAGSVTEVELVVQ